MPIFQTTSYVFEDPESAAAYFNLQEYGNTYSRIMNPTVAVFEERVANLEGGCGAVAFASGIAAQAAALFTLLSPGDHVVASSALYGGTVNQFKHMLRKLSVGLTWVNPDDLDAWKAAVRGNTKAFYGETIGNPGGNVLDIEAIAAIAHDHELPLVVDNTFATPFLCRPIEWGADIVLHSATKFIGGHGTSIGGVVVDSGQFNWSNGRFPVVAEPSPAYHGLQFHETFGTYGYLMKLRAETLRDLGAAMSPFNAFLFLQGLETLSLRMARHVENAAAVAGYLESHELASNVTYPGLLTSRYRPLVDKYLPCGAGAVFSFDCRGGRSAGDPPDSDPLRPAHTLRTITPGRARGPLIGGNLSLIATTMGTPYEIETQGRILFLEDVDEQPYSVDRMLTQLRLAGKLSAAAGVVFGECNNCRPREFQPSFESAFSLGEVLLDSILAGLARPGALGPHHRPHRRPGHSAAGRGGHARFRERRTHHRGIRNCLNRVGSVPALTARESEFRPAARYGLGQRPPESLIRVLRVESPTGPLLSSSRPSLDATCSRQARLSLFAIARWRRLTWKIDRAGRSPPARGSTNRLHRRPLSSEKIGVLRKL